MRIGTILALVIVAGACGDDLHGLTLHEWQSSRRAAECERYMRCGLIDDVSRCTAFFRMSYDPALEDLVNAGKARFDPIAAEQCNEALASRSCDLTAADAREVPAVCTHVLTGAVASGATCLDDRECQTDRCEQPTCDRDACCPGECAVFRAPGKLGGDCDVTIGCETGAFCAADLTCHALVAVAGPCRDDHECAFGLACIGATELEDGACRALAKLGEECPYQRCAEIGARCDGQTCVKIGRPGDPCSGPGECSEFDECDVAQHRCRALPSLGEPCFATCAGEAWCAAMSGASTCSTPQSNSAPCTADDQCATQFCEEGPIFDQCAEPALCI